MGILSGITGKVAEVDQYGHARLDITPAQFRAAGFEPGDVVTVKAGAYEGDVPFFNGYYVDIGEYMVRAYPGDSHIAVCINYGRFADAAGVAPGDAVTITMKEKAGALAAQEINALVYTNERADYGSDEIFANFREIRAGRIGRGKLYRSASPVNDRYNRSSVANRLMEKAGVKAVMNTADSGDDIRAFAAREGFDSAYYMELFRNGHVIALGMPVNFTSDEFGKAVAKGLAFLSGQDTPFLIHCSEGRDRAGFVSMVVEALMGASGEEIVGDYLESYVNYYHLDPAADAGKLEIIAGRNVREMIRAVAGTEKVRDPTGAGLASAAESYLLSHGMAEDAIRALKEKLE